MRNQHGVTIDLMSTTRGANVALGGGGTHMEIPPSGFEAVRLLKSAEASAGRAEDAAHRTEDAATRMEAAAQRTEEIANRMEGTRLAGRAARGQGVAGRM
jgi:hypothetical protein